MQAYTDCIRNDKPANWDDFSLGHQNVSRKVRLHILCEEQDSLCGYTELPISDPFDCHIDHYRKKSQFQALTFDWDNFVVATMDDGFGARYKDNKSGIKAADYGSILNPVTANVESYFEYSLLGDILPKQQGLTAGQKVLAQKTIDIFNLKHQSLRARRYGVIKIIESYQDLPDEDVRDCLQDVGFRSLVEQLLRDRKL